MNKTRIEWCDYTINPVKGLCPMACPYCYARRMYKRFKWNPEIRYDPTIILGDIPDKPSRIFIGSTVELFGEWVRPEWLHDIFTYIKEYERQGEKHIFIFLTKKPENLIRWSPFPENCWVLASVTNQAQYDHSINYLGEVEARVIGLSIEPLLGRIVMDRDAGQRWIILGQQTPASIKTAPKIEWVKEIVQACDKASIPVFLKNNLSYLWEKNCSLFPEWALRKGSSSLLRQEFPK